MPPYRVHCRRSSPIVTTATSSGRHPLIASRLPMIVQYGQTAGECLKSAREEVLVRGLIDWVALERVRRRVARENAGEPLSVIQDKTLDLIRSLVSDGIFEVGDLMGEGGRFVAWKTPLDESIQRIRDVYVTKFEDEKEWWCCWLRLTDKGQQVAEAIEASTDRLRVADRFSDYPLR